MFVMYREDGKACNVAKEQVEIMKNAGYTFEKPATKQEPKVEEKKVQVK